MIEKLDSNNTNNTPETPVLDNHGSETEEGNDIEQNQPLIISDGTHKIAQPNGNYMITPFKDGRINGEALLYNNKGELIAKICYVDDKINGQTTLYDANGKVEVICYYQDEVLEGTLSTYQPNGFKQLQAEYKEGKLNGILTAYNEFGDLCQSITYSQGYKQGLSRSYFSKLQGGGLCQQSYYEGDLLTNKQETFYPTGEILQISTYDKGKETNPPLNFDKHGKPLT